MFFTAPVMGSVLDLDMKSYKDIQHFDGKKKKKENSLESQTQTRALTLAADMLQIKTGTTLGYTNHRRGKHECVTTRAARG